ncbi:unnamed protein product, partial [Echinostoma caproni]|uniref:RanBP2-type domain-containing protein n=1 Tax=Echinostoma caproni TaxID=27848 RepID=A0A183ACK2_9TREM
MPSPRAQSVEKLDGVTLPYGSEKVVSVKKRSKQGTGKTQPLTINTSDARMFSTSEGDLTMRKLIRRERKRYSGVYEDPKTHRMSLYNSHKKSQDSRKSHVLSSVLFEPNSNRRRVISCLELNAPEPIELESVPIERMRNGDTTNGPVSVPVFTEGRLNQGTFVFPRDSTRLKTPREREVFVSVRNDDADSHGIRYSGIFQPDLQRHRSSSRHLRKSRSSNIYQPTTTPMWSPFVPVAVNFCPNCMASTCQRCRNSISSPRKSFSQDLLAGTPYPYEPADYRGSQYMDMPQPPIPQYPPSYHHHHHYQQQQQQRQRMSSYYSGSRMSDIDRVYTMPSRTNLLNTSIEELSGYGYENDRTVD